MNSRPTLVRGIVYLSTLTCLEAELSDYFLRNREEDRILDNYKNRTETTKFVKQDWFLNQPFTHDVLFHLNPKSSVFDVSLRRQFLREKKKEASFKDFVTFLMLGVFVPRFAFGVASVNLAKNMLLNLDIENDRLMTFLEWSEFGKYARLVFIGLPLAAFV